MLLPCFYLNLTCIYELTLYIMKQLLTFLLMGLLANTWSQTPQLNLNGKAKLTGTLIDSLTHKPIPYASVALLAGDKIVNGSLTNEEGVFELTGLSEGTYSPQITGLGYRTIRLPDVIINRSSNVFSLGIIQLKPFAQLLKSIDVVGQAPLVEHQIDKVVYHADKDIGAATGDAADILRRAPMVTVDADGTPSLRGSTALRLLINGKPSGLMANQAADALRSIPASQIKSVEIITSPASQYEAEGTAGIINIILKRKTIEGINANLDAVLGTLRGIGNANVTYQRKRLTLIGNIGGNKLWHQVSNGCFYRIDNRFGTETQQSGMQKDTRYAANGNIGLELDLSKRSTLMMTIRSTTSANETGGSGQTEYQTQQQLNTISSIIKQEGSGYSIDWITDFRHRLSREGEEINLSAQYSHNEGQPFYQTRLNYKQGVVWAERSEGKNKWTEQTAQFDYTLPWEKGNLATGAKVIHRQLNTQREVYQLDETIDTEQLNAERSNRLTYKQTVGAFYATINHTLTPLLSLKLGLRYELTQLEGLSVSAQYCPVFYQKYGNLFPYAALLRRFKKHEQTLRLVYNKRLQRPGIGYLNPFLSASNPFYRSQGDPSLKPELTHQIELAYSMSKNKHSLNIATYYRLTRQLIERYTRLSLNILKVIDSTTAQTVVATDTYGNIGVLSSWGLNLFGSFNLSSQWSMRSSVNLSTYQLLLQKEYPALSAQTGIQGSLNGSTQYQFKKGLSIEFSGVYNTPRRNPQGWSNHFSFFSVNLRKQFPSKKGYWQLNIIEPFQGRKTYRTEIEGDGFYQTSNRLSPFRAINLSFNLNIGKEIKRQGRSSKINNDDLK
jgi:ferric enterobactin receptor